MPVCPCLLSALKSGSKVSFKRFDNVMFTYCTNVAVRCWCTVKMGVGKLLVKLETVHREFDET